MQQRDRDQAGHALAEYTVTEAGFGADLGAEVHEHQVPQQGSVPPPSSSWPRSGRREAPRRRRLERPHPAEQRGPGQGVENLKKHIENVHRFGLPVVVAINSFLRHRRRDQFIKDKCAYLGVEFRARALARGGSGARLARA